MKNNTIAHSLFTDFDINLFRAGKHYNLFDKMGSHPMTVDGVDGTYFAVWAPSAKAVSVIGDFNFWNDKQHRLNVRWDGSGIWEGFVPEALENMRYKYKIKSHHNDVVTEKADPYAYSYEHPPNTASVIATIDGYKWKDKAWMGY